MVDLATETDEKLVTDEKPKGAQKPKRRLRGLFFKDHPTKRTNEVNPGWNVDEELAQLRKHEPEDFSDQSEKGKREVFLLDSGGWPVELGRFERGKPSFVERQVLISPDEKVKDGDIVLYDHIRKNVPAIDPKDRKEKIMPVHAVAKMGRVRVDENSGKVTLSVLDIPQTQKVAKRIIKNEEGVRILIPRLNEKTTQYNLIQSPVDAEVPIVGKRLSKEIAGVTPEEIPEIMAEIFDPREDQREDGATKDVDLKEGYGPLGFSFYGERPDPLEVALPNKSKTKLERLSVEINHTKLKKSFDEGSRVLIVYENNTGELNKAYDSGQDQIKLRELSRDYSVPDDVDEPDFKSIEDEAAWLEKNGTPYVRTATPRVNATRGDVSVGEQSFDVFVPVRSPDGRKLIMEPVNEKQLAGWRRMIQANAKKRTKEYNTRLHPKEYEALVGNQTN